MSIGQLKTCVLDIVDIEYNFLNIFLENVTRTFYVLKHGQNPRVVVTIVNVDNATILCDFCIIRSPVSHSLMKHDSTKAVSLG